MTIYYAKPYRTFAMLETIEAIYENGTFKPLHPVDLPEGTHVLINTNVSTSQQLRSTAAEAQLS